MIKRAIMGVKIILSFWNHNDAASTNHSQREKKKEKNKQKERKDTLQSLPGNIEFQGIKAVSPESVVCHPTCHVLHALRVLSHSPRHLHHQVIYYVIPSS